MANNYKYLIALFAIVLITGFVLFSGKKSETDVIQISPSPTPNLSNLPTQAEEVNATITPMQESNELQIEDLKLGSGAEAIVGKKVTVNYKGTLTNGEQFDSSYERGQPFSFVLGEGAVIQGWDEGVPGMKTGGKRKLTIPPSLGYGSQAVGTIPPNSTLIFEVELLKVE